MAESREEHPAEGMNVKGEAFRLLVSTRGWKPLLEASSFDDEVCVEVDQSGFKRQFQTCSSSTTVPPGVINTAVTASMRF
jgi:hypothetical protein